MHGEEHTDEIGMHTVLYSLQRRVDQPPARRRERRKRRSADAENADRSRKVDRLGVFARKTPNARYRPPHAPEEVRGGPSCVGSVSYTHLTLPTINWV